MKVVLFCGGLGTRLREHSDTIPKPLVPIGQRPIIWHIMRYYAHFGHKEFILCLGYRGDLIREYFLNYNPNIARDFTMLEGGKRLEPAASDISDWKISFVDTGLHANIGQRLAAVRDWLGGDELFLANYSDQLSDLPLEKYIEDAKASGAVASFVSIRPSQSYHCVLSDEGGVVKSLTEMHQFDVWVNGGYFVLRKEIFDYINPGEELVVEPFARLAKERRLWTQRYTGFWKAMDTFKDKITYDRMDGTGDRPWRVWANGDGKAL